MNIEVKLFYKWYWKKFLSAILPQFFIQSKIAISYPLSSLKKVSMEQNNNAFTREKHIIDGFGGNPINEY